MSRSAQQAFSKSKDISAYTRNGRASWIGSKLIQSIGVEPARLDEVHQAMMMNILHEGDDAQSPVSDEVHTLAAHIAAVAQVAENAAAFGGPDAAIVAVMRESGQSIDPLLAQNFLRLASSSIFWMALDSANDAKSQ
jgi:hypothetical protein